MFVVVPTFSTSTELAPLAQEAFDFFKVLMSSEMHQHLLALKVLFIFSGIGFIVMFVYLVLHTEWLHWTLASDFYDFLQAKKRLLGITNQKNVEAWKKIKKGLEKDYEAQWKVSVIEAMTFLDGILSKSGYQGDNLLERLNKVPAEDVSNISFLIKDESIYHNIILDPNYRFTRDKAHEVIGNVEQALTQLEII